MAKQMTGKGYAGLLLVLAAAILFSAVPPAQAGPVRVLDDASVYISGMRLDVDARPDREGIQYSMTAVQGVPSSVGVLLGAPGSTETRELSGVKILADVSGPGFTSGPEQMEGTPGNGIGLPAFTVAGEYLLYNVRLCDADQNVILRRDPSLPAVVITVIEELLVTQVSSRALSASEIKDLGIVIDEDSYTAVNFAVGLTLGSEPVTVDLPVLLPKTTGLAVTTPPPSQIPGLQEALDRINIPNLTLSGFQLQAPPDPELSDIEIPPINGVIVIPGNIGYLKQIFSVFLQATNVAPEGSGLILNNAKAAIELPPGEDDIPDSPDDPLTLAATTQGVSDTLPLTNSEGSDAIAPLSTNQAEFLVVGEREGTHTVTFAITGDLTVPGLDHTVAMTGAAAGVVQVKNPTFSLVLSHPSVVREGEDYSLCVTVTNTSASPANYFSLALNNRSLNGCRPADGETGERTLDELLPGDSALFTFRMKALATGEVRGTAAKADDNIDGSFVLTTGVGDSGIPLSPDTLVLPSTVDYLPTDPADLAFAARRLLGQAYSVAVAPEGHLPEGLSRVAKSFVFERAVVLAQTGLHVRFGEEPTAAAFDLAADYLGADVNRLAELYSDPESALKNFAAFDKLRRKSSAGNDFCDTAAAVMGGALQSESLADFMGRISSERASYPPHLCFGVSGASTYVKMTDADGNALGRLAGDQDFARAIPYAGRFFLSATDRMLYAAVPDSESYVFELSVPQGGDLSVSLVLPNGSGMGMALFAADALPAGSYGRIAWSAAAPGTVTLALDTDGDGAADQSLAPSSFDSVPDAQPRVLGVHQWGKGGVPDADSFELGDALGRLVGVLFSEEVRADGAGAKANYLAEGLGISQVLAQPDGRMVFLVLEKPVGPFIARNLEVSNVLDLADQPMADETRAIVPDPELGAGATYAGQVVTAEGRTVPFARVRYIAPVQLIDPITRIEEVIPVVVSDITADANGSFDFDFILQNTVEDKSGRPDTTFTFSAADPSNGREGEAQSRVLFDGQSMRFNVVMRGLGAVQGRVYDEDGLPVAGGDPGSLASIAVYAFHTSTRETRISWVDADGYYAFPRTFIPDSGDPVTVSGLAAGNVLLRVVRTSDQATAAATVNVVEQETPIVKDLVLSSLTASLSLRVVEADGATGAAGVPVTVYGRVLSPDYLSTGETETGVVAAGTTDAEGRIEFSTVPAGSVTVKAYRSATGELARQTLSLSSGETRNVSLVLPGFGASVTGCVRDAVGNPVPGALVSTGYQITLADDQGCFRFDSMPLGEFALTARRITSLAIGSVSGTLYTKDDEAEVLIELEPTGSIRGSVYSAEGGILPLQKVQLWIKKPNGYYVIGNAETNLEGEYVFADYPLGEYSVRAVTGNYGDGGMALASLEVVNDVKIADITFRGLGQISGRVEEKLSDTNSIPVVADVVITRKVWRVLPNQSFSNNYYLEFVEKLKDVDGLADQVDQALASVNFPTESSVFFMLTDETAHVRSDANGDFSFTGPVTGGPFTVAAFGPYLAPAELRSEIPRSADPDDRNVYVGVLLLEAAVSSVSGTVFLPDNLTPVGENVKVVLQSLDSSGSVTGVSGSITQPVMPEQTVYTDAEGRFSFEMVLRGRVALTADTGAPANPQPLTIAGIDTASFEDLNVRLYGKASGVAPADPESLTLNVRLAGVAGLDVSVVKNDGAAWVPVENTQISVSGIGTIYDADGHAEILPVPEGPFSVTATGLDLNATGSVSGVVPTAPGNGYAIPVEVRLGQAVGQDGEASDVGFFGTVMGLVSRADGEPVTNPCQVTVKASGGVQVLATSDAFGQYTAVNVPSGFFTARAFEPLSGRSGSASGSLTDEGVPAVADIYLQGLGTVQGTVCEGTGAALTHAVDLSLAPAASPGDKIIGRTDADGSYSLPGVPVGVYTVTATDTVSGLSGSASGELNEDGEVAVTDVSLAAAGRIFGVIYGPGVFTDEDGNPVHADGSAWGEPVPRAAQATVTLRQGTATETLVANQAGEYTSSSNLVMGTWTVRAVSSGQDDGCETEATLTHAGEAVRASMGLNGLGSISGEVRYSDESPAQYALVSLQSDSPFARAGSPVMCDENGLFTITGVNRGGFVLTARLDALSGTAGGVIESHEQVVEFFNEEAISLSASGSITGRVLLEDGTTPAEGARIEIVDGVHLVAFADAEGGYSFTQIPRDSYTVWFSDPASGGIGSAAAALSGDALDLGDMTLDATRPYVASTSPAADAGDVSPAGAVRVLFNEAIEPASLTSDSVKVMENGTTAAGTLSLSADGKEISFTPQGAFADMARISVKVCADRLDFEGQVTTPGIRDLVGLTMAADHSFAFTTGDTGSPTVLSVTPADGSVNLNTASVVRVTFSEPVLPDSAGAAFSLTDELSGLPVAGTFAAVDGLGGRVFVFAPTALSINATYRVDVAAGVLDLVGNPSVEAYSATFSTTDNMAPEISSLVWMDGASLIAGTIVPVTAEATDASGIAKVEFFVNGLPRATDATFPFVYGLHLDPAYGNEATVSAVATDGAGNRGPARALAVPISPDQAPELYEISLSSDPAGLGQLITATAGARDDLGVSRIVLVVEDGALGSFTRSFASGSTEASADVTFSVPEDWNLTREISIRAIARDGAGQDSAEASYSLSVEDGIAPQVNFTSPAAGSSFETGTPISLLVSASDTGGLASLVLAVEGAGADHDTWTSQGFVTSRSETFILTIPAGAQPSEPVNATVTATDNAGNTKTASITLWPADHLPPQADLSAGSDLEMEPGIIRYVTLTADDTVGVTRMRVKAGDFFSETREISAAAHTVQHFGITAPYDMPLDTEVIVSATVWDGSGNQAEAAPLTLTCTDKTPPEVELLEPTDGSTVMPGSVISIRIHATDHYGVGRLSFHSNGISGSGEEEFAPPAPDAYTEFTLQVPDTPDVGGQLIDIQATAVDAGGLDASTSWVSVLVQDIWPPRATQIYPPDGAADMEPDLVVMVGFSERVDPATVGEETLILAGADGRTLTGTYWFESDTLARFQPSLALGYEQAYTLTVTGGITDMAGNGLSPQAQASFTVRPADTPWDVDDDGDGFTELMGDCKDAGVDAAEIHPGALEYCGDGIDQNCDGRDLSCARTCDPMAGVRKLHYTAPQTVGCGGNSVAVSERFAVVGAPEYDSDGINNSGRAIIFERAGAEWVQVQDVQVAYGEPNPADTDLLGSSVALSGETLLIGVPRDDDTASGSGSVLVLVRQPDGSWVQEAKLHSPTPASWAYFGTSVALEGDRAVVGEPGGSNQYGLVYVFERSAGIWQCMGTLRAGLNAEISGYIAYPGLGTSVSLWGDRIVAGGPNNYTTGGVAVVFEKASGSWTEQARLYATGTSGFGRAVSLCGNRLIAGAPQENGSIGAAYLFTKAADGTWQQAERIEAPLEDERVGGSFFGGSVALYGDLLAIGAYGYAKSDGGKVYLYESDDGSSFEPATKLHPSSEDYLSGYNYGYSLALNQGFLAVGARTAAVRDTSLPDRPWVDIAGTAYIHRVYCEDLGPDADDDGDGFTDNEGDCDDGDPGVNPFKAEICGDGIDQNCDGVDECPLDDDFDLDGYTENQGDCSDEDASIHPGALEVCGDGIDQNCDGQDLACGSCVIPVSAPSLDLPAAARQNGSWLGMSAALSGSYAAAGAPRFDGAFGAEQGAVVFFEYAGGAWAPLTDVFLEQAGDAPAAGDQLGTALALDGETALVGVPYDDDSDLANSGSVIILTRNAQGAWEQIGELHAEPMEQGGRFGSALALSGTRAVVGAPGADGNKGAAYVFDRIGGAWRQSARLTAEGTSVAGGLGTSVSLSGDRVLAGATSYKIGNYSGYGAALVYEYKKGFWERTGTLMAEDVAYNALFGSSVSLMGDWALVGAPKDSYDGYSAVGSAFLFHFSSQEGWDAPPVKFSVTAVQSDTNFGHCVRLYGDYLAISAYWDRANNTARAGAVYLYQRNQDDSLSQLQKLTPSDIGYQDAFGTSLALDSGNLFSGAATGNSPGMADTGAVYMYRFYCEPAP